MEQCTQTIRHFTQKTFSTNKHIKFTLKTNNITNAKLTKQLLLALKQVHLVCVLKKIEKLQCIGKSLKQLLSILEFMNLDT